MERAAARQQSVKPGEEGRPAEVAGLGLAPPVADSALPRRRAGTGWRVPRAGLEDR